MVSEFGLHNTPAPTWDDTVARRPHAVLSVAQLSAAEREQLRQKGIPFVVFDPTTELPDDVPFVGRDELVRRPDGDPAPARARPPPDRPGQRARARVVLHAPARTATVPRWPPPACRSTPTWWSGPR